MGQLMSGGGAGGATGAGGAGAPPGGPLGGAGGARERVAREVAANAGVLMYAKTTCGYCRLGVELLAPLLEGLPLSVVQLDEIPDGAAVQGALLERTGQRTVPNCFVGRQHVGGHDDLKRLHRAGKLEPLLRGMAREPPRSPL